MKYFLKHVFAFFIILQTAFAENTNQYSPVGFWQTIDDATGRPKAVVQLWEDAQQVLYGKVVKLYSKPGQTENQTKKQLCFACTDQRRNQPIIGMVVLENLTQDKDNLNQWTGGQIIDPKNGKNYHCLLQMLAKGQKMRVKGYIGIPVFGRSQTWLRMSDQQFSLIS